MLGNFRKRTVEFTSRISSLQVATINTLDKDLMEAKTELGEILIQQEVYWEQRSRLL